MSSIYPAAEKKLNTQLIYKQQYVKAAKSLFQKKKHCENFSIIPKIFILIVFKVRVYLTDPFQISFLT